MTPRPQQEKDSERIKLIPEVMKWVAQLNQVIVTGDVEKGEPGLLENVRNMAKDIKEMKDRQVNYAELERRVSEIEKRHIALDSEKKQKWEMVNKYNLTLFGIVATQIIVLIFEYFKR